MSCAFCQKQIDDSQAFLELSCGKHLAHSSHSKLTCPEFECSFANVVGGRLATPVAPAAVPVAVAAVPVSAQKTSTGGGGGGESDAIAERRAISLARVTEPLSPPRSGGVRRVIGSVMRTISKLVDSSKPDREASGDPLTLLASRVPLKEIVERHGYDITELINDHGITINDFLRNGYALGEMCDAFSSRMNEREGMDVLYYLGVAAEHIRLMPMETLRSRLGYRPEMLEILGYRFAPSGAWTIADMIGVGLTMPLVIKAGMQTAADWERLKAASAPVTLQMLQAFGVTPELEASLVTRADLPSAVAVQQQQQQPVYHSEASLTAVPLPCQKTLYTFYDPATVSPLTDFAAQKPAPVQPTVTASACTIGATTTTAQEEQFVHAPGIPMPRGATVLARSQPSSSLAQPNKGPRLVPKKLK